MHQCLYLSRVQHINGVQQIIHIETDFQLLTLIVYLQLFLGLFLFGIVRLCAGYWGPASGEHRGTFRWTESKYVSKPVQTFPVRKYTLGVGFGYDFLVIRELAVDKLGSKPGFRQHNTYVV